MRGLLAMLATLLWLSAGSLQAQDPVPPASEAATPSPTAFRTTQAVPPVPFTPTPIPSSQLAATPLEHPLSTEGYRPSGGGMGQLAGYLCLLLALFGGGIWIMRHGVPNFRMGAKVDRRLRIEETRSLGGRQFLVVAEYEGQKMLLGVCPGRIDHLCVLNPTVFPPISPEAPAHES